MKKKTLDRNPKLEQKPSVVDLYQALLKEHGPQGWWPVSSEVSGEGYHPGNFIYPKSRQGRFEVCVGAVLTQNTAWTNVEKAIGSLSGRGLMDPEAIPLEPLESLQECIRSVGYFVQKSAYLKNVSQWFQENDESLFEGRNKNSRAGLLAVKGVGPETADSILLYAYRVPTFVVDAYTKRILVAEQMIEETWKYAQIQNLFHRKLSPDFQLYQEYHALIVAHAKKYYRKRKEMFASR